jgi:uncharacterized protein (TIGR03437 family)
VQLTAGFQVLGIQSLPGGTGNGAGPSGPMKVAVWYPSVAAASSHVYSQNNLLGYVSGMVASNAAITDCGSAGLRFPLIIFSHADITCGTETTFLTEELARRGYIVAAPDHADHTCTSDTTGLSAAGVPIDITGILTSDSSVRYRHFDVTATVNYLLQTPAWSASIDPAKIGIEGHSLGGYTAFAEIGGFDTWYDSRFVAGIMLSPYTQPFLPPYQVPSRVPFVTVPQMWSSGSLVYDAGVQPWVIGPTNCNQPCTKSPGAFQQAQFPKYYGQLAAGLGDGARMASHASFSDLICGGTDKAPTTVQACLGIGNAALITNYSEDFWDHYLTGRAPARLYAPGSWDTYWRTGGVPGGTYWTGFPAAPNSIAAIKGEGLAAAIPSDQQPVGSASMPMSINGVTITITDNNGVSRPAPLYAISPGQINFVVPPGLPQNYYTVTVKNASGAVVASGPLSTYSVSPAFFAISTAPGQTGPGWGWGWAQVGSNYFPIFDQGAWSPIPLDVSQGNTYLVLSGTGVRSAAGGLQASVGGVSVPISTTPYIYQGIDAVAIGPLPASLAGRGQVDIVISAGGMQSNSVDIVIQ